MILKLAHFLTSEKVSLPIIKSLHSCFYFQLFFYNIFSKILTPVLLALEVLVLVVAEPVVRVPLFEGVSVHRVGGDVAIQNRLLLHLILTHQNKSNKLAGLNPISNFFPP